MGLTAESESRERTQKNVEAANLDAARSLRNRRSENDDWRRITFLIRESVPVKRDGKDGKRGGGRAVSKDERDVIVQTVALSLWESGKHSEFLTDLREGRGDYVRRTLNQRCASALRDGNGWRDSEQTSAVRTRSGGDRGLVPGPVAANTADVIAEGDEGGEPLTVIDAQTMSDYQRGMDEGGALPSLRVDVIDHVGAMLSAMDVPAVLTRKGRSHAGATAVGSALAIGLGMTSADVCQLHGIGSDSLKHVLAAGRLWLCDNVPAGDLLALRESTAVALGLTDPKPSKRERAWKHLIRSLSDDHSRAKRDGSNVRAVPVLHYGCQTPEEAAREERRRVRAALAVGRPLPLSEGHSAPESRGRPAPAPVPIGHPRPETLAAMARVGRPRWERCESPSDWYTAERERVQRERAEGTMRKAAPAVQTAQDRWGRVVTNPAPRPVEGL